MSTFDKMKAQEERRAAIKKQMEAMEAAAEPRSQASTPTTTRRRNTSTSSSRDSPGTVETARRFLVDEETMMTSLHSMTRGQVWSAGASTRRNLIRLARNRERVSGLV